MTLAELIERYRTESSDKALPYFVEDDELTRFFNDAQREAAVRGRLLYEHSSKSVGQIAVKVDQAAYSLHASLYELAHCAFREDGREGRNPVRLVSPEWLDANVRDWRDQEGVPQYAVQDDKTIRLVPVPVVTGTLLLEGYRLPLQELEGSDDEPEINAAHHDKLVYWALHKAFSIPDGELFDAARAAQAEQQFTDYFGLRPDSDLRRLTREDTQHHVTAFWP